MTYAEIESLTWDQMYEELGLSHKDPWEFFYEKQRDAHTKLFDDLCAAQNLTLAKLRSMPMAEMIAALTDLNPKMKIEEPMARAALAGYLDRKSKR
jgi:hypothetical protein